MRSIIAGVLALIGVLGIARMQPQLVRSIKRAKSHEDVTLVPPPDKVKLVSLRYEAMAVDLLWAKLLLEYGTHWSEKRIFNDAPRYLDAILALDPQFRDVYRYADSILCFRSGTTATIADAKLTREYFERGVKALPDDADVWLRYGQFLAFFGPSFVTDAPTLEEWRVTGARAIIRAVELGADADAALSATAILGKAGEREAIVEHLKRAYALASDDATREQIAEQLVRLKHDQDADTVRRAASAFNDYREQHFPFLSVTMLELSGPVRDPAACVGLANARTSACLGNWSRIIGEKRGGPR